MNYPLLKKAPIIEAVLCIYYDTDDDVLSQYEDIFKDVIDDFPKIETKYYPKISFKELGSSTKSVKEDEYRKIDSILLRNIDKSKYIMVSQNSFSIHIVGKYTEWNDLFNFSLEYWNVFSSNVVINKTPTISLRYMNKLRFKSPVQLEKYFNLSSVNEKSIGYTMFDFSTKAMFFDEENKSTANIALYNDRNFEEKDMLEFNFDIEVTQSVENDDIIWDCIGYCIESNQDLTEEA